MFTTWWCAKVTVTMVTVIMVTMLWYRSVSALPLPIIFPEFSQTSTFPYFIDWSLIGRGLIHTIGVFFSFYTLNQIWVFHFVDREKEETRQTEGFISLHLPTWQLTENFYLSREFLPEHDIQPFKIIGDNLEIICIIWPLPLNRLNISLPLMMMRSDMFWI